MGPLIEEIEIVLGEQRGVKRHRVMLLVLPSGIRRLYTDIMGAHSPPIAWATFPSNEGPIISCSSGPPLRAWLPLNASTKSDDAENIRRRECGDRRGQSDLCRVRPSTSDIGRTEVRGYLAAPGDLSELTGKILRIALITIAPGARS